ncbi:MAG: YceI family protein [Opitutaceae bacterium]|nr:YceI family protein [Verrucomicrobiales bacterium]
MKRSLLLAIFTAVAFATANAAETYQIDPAHSTIGFKIKHFFSKIGGRFADVNGTISIDPADPQKSTVEATVTVKSIDTANAKRDEHLKAADFFDAEKFPAMTFKSKKVKTIDDKSADVIGDLTIRGVTKEVPLKVKFLGKGKGMGGGEITGWEATTTISRKEFGLTWDKVVEGVAAVGDEVEIELQIEAGKAKG